MDQRIASGSGAEPAQRIHRACVVAGCWCGSTTAATKATAAALRNSVLRPMGAVSGASANLTSIALRSVGLPVV